MKLSLLVLLGLGLQVAVTKTVYNKEEEVPIAYNDRQDPHFWEKSGKVEGDMVLTPEQAEMLYSGKEKRNGLIRTKFRWPNKVIPYVISNDFTASEKRFIERVLQEDYARTCIRVVRRTNQHDYIFVTGEDTGCWSDVGRQGGIQKLNLEPDGCLTYSTVVHEFLHAAGFHHMQSANDRDNFITVQWRNIEKGEKHNFKKFTKNTVSNFGQPYDYGSVMHYRTNAFSKNGRDTITPKKNVQIGTAPRLSRIDIAKLNRMYNC